MKVVTVIILCAIVGAVVSSSNDNPLEPDGVVATSAATPLTNDDEFDIMIHHVADAGLLGVGPNKPGRVGLWAHGDSFDSDAEFFAEEDKTFSKWFVEHQREQQRKKIEEIQKKRKSDKKKDDTISGDNGATTKAAILLRTTNRRKVLDSSSNPLHTKFKALQVDARGTFKRFLRALGISNHTFSDAESAYRDFFSDGPLGASTLSSSTNSIIADFVAQEDQKKKPASSKKGEPLQLPKGNSSSSGAGNTTAWIAATWKAAKRWWTQHSHRMFLRPSIPAPIILDDEQMKLFDLELDALLQDQKNLDAHLERAENGLHDTERKLRETRLLKAEKKTDVDDDLLLDDEESASSSANNNKKKNVAVPKVDADAQLETRRRQEERMSKYSEMRTALRNEVAERLTAIRHILTSHRTHQFHLLRSAAAIVPDVLTSLRARRSALKDAMTKNDESTVQLRQGMKHMTKESKQVQLHIQDLEGIETSANAVLRRRRAGATIDQVSKALVWTVQHRLGVSQDESDDTGDSSFSTISSRSVFLKVFGLTKSEMQDLVVIPLLCSIIGCWALQFVCKWACMALTSMYRSAEYRYQRRKGILSPKNKDEVMKFDLRATIFRLLMALIRLAIVAVTMLKSFCPIILPLACLLWMEGLIIHRESRTELGLPMTVLYHVTHFGTALQSAALALCTLLVICANVIFSDGRIGGTSFANGTKGRKLSSKK